MGKILDQIKAGKVLVSDGAWGTFLQQKGMKLGECPEEWNITDAWVKNSVGEKIVDFKKLDLIADGKIIKVAKTTVEKLLENDPHLEHPDNFELRTYYAKQYKGKNKWSRIS